MYAVVDINTELPYSLLILIWSALNNPNSNNGRALLSVRAMHNSQA